MEPLQSAYCKHHATETALLKIQTDILDAMDDKLVTCLVLLDLSAAFDTVPHCELINRLKYRFGLGGVVLQWLTNYLMDHTQCIVIDANGNDPTTGHSGFTSVKQGVPQGSSLGPNCLQCSYLQLVIYVGNTTSSSISMLMIAKYT